MMKKHLTILMVIVVIVIVGVLTYVTGLFPYRLFGPFENPPLSGQPNCDKEYRFKVNEIISSEDDFAKFLKDYQFEQEVRNKLKAIDLDTLKTKINVDLSKAIFSNEKIFSLSLTNKDFNDNWPWMITIKISKTGHVSTRHCAGI